MQPTHPLVVPALLAGILVVLLVGVISFIAIGSASLKWQERIVCELQGYSDCESTVGTSR